MASFDITAQINLRGPTNVKKIAADIRKQLGSIKSSVDLKIDAKTAKNVATINRNFQQLNRTLQGSRTSIAGVTKAFNDLNRSMQSLSSTSRSANQSVSQVAKSAASAANAVQKVAQTTTNASEGIRKFGAEVASTVRRFAAFNVVSTIIGGLTSQITQGISSFIEYERELAKVQQVTNTTAAGLQQLSKGIQEASVATGAAATELAKVSVVLSQAGLSARETNEALQTLAKSTLAPTFGEITETTEGAIAILRQFSLETSELESALGSINAVAGQFAVSAQDIITAVKQAGAVFASSSKGISEGTDALNEFIAVFTSVRQTTRESAETIGTGLKTIITRLQRLDTIESLKQFGIQLTDLEGKFVGPFEAIKRLNEGLATLDPRDVRFGAIIEELGGFRQVGKVIPLIQQFAVAQEALNVAQDGSTSLTDQQIIAQQTLAVQLQKTSANFQELITNVANSDAFQSITKNILIFTNAVIDLIDALKDVIPVLATIAAANILPSLAAFAGGFGRKLFGANTGGMVPHHFASGGYVPGRGDKDTVPAMLTPGEFVIRKKAVQAIGVDNLGAMNNGASPAAVQAKNNGGMIQYFANGGKVSVDYANKKPNPSEERELIGNNIVNSVNSLADFYDPSAKQYNSRKSPKNIANYNGIVGGIFESAVELVAGNANKQKNEAVWDYPTGLGDTTLFNNVPGLGVPTDAKKSASTATVRKKLKAHYRNAQGTDLNRKNFGIVAFGKGEDYEYNFDVDEIKSEVAGQRATAAKAQGRNKGGLIQFFEDGGSVLPITGTGKVTQKNLANATIADLEATLKSPKLSATGRASVQAALDQANTAANAPDIAVVGILPLGYSKDYPVGKFGPTQAKLHARGLPETKANIVKEISGGLQGLVGNVAQKLAGRSQLLTAEQEKATGLENVQGTVFEAVLSSLGAVGGTVQNQALDYRNGLGPAASLYKGIGADWPTEVKRDVTGSGLTRAKGEFARYFTEQAQTSKIQNFAQGGKVQSRIKTTGGNTITSVFEDGQSSAGEVVAKNIGQNLFSVISSQASGGGGRALYDSAMKQATSQGGSLTSDRSRVSASALSRIWATYFNKGTSKDGKKVSKRPVPDNMLYTGSFFDESDYPSPNPKSWQGKAVPLQYAYQQFADGGAASGGDTVPAMLTPGEFVLNKKAAKRIGLAKLNQLNYADKAQGFAKGGPVGGVQYFDGGGGPDPLNAGGIGDNDPCCPEVLEAAKIQKEAANAQKDAAEAQGEAAEEQEDAAKESNIGQQIIFSLIGPAIEQGLRRAFPSSALAAGAGEGIQSGLATYQQTDVALSTLAGASKFFTGRLKFLGTALNFLGKNSKVIAGVFGTLAGVFGARRGFIEKSLELLSKTVEEGAKDTAEAFKDVRTALNDPDATNESVAAKLDVAATNLAQVTKDREILAKKQKQDLQPTFSFLEGEEGRTLREAQERQIDRDLFEGPAREAEQILADAVSSGRDLSTVLAEQADGGRQFKETIAKADAAYREQFAILTAQRDQYQKGSAGYNQAQAALDTLTDTYYVQNTEILQNTIKIKEAERALEENRRRLIAATTSLDRYIEAFGQSIAIAGDRFEASGRAAEETAKGFAGASLDNLFSENITRLQNPTAFTAAENQTALDPLRDILGDNADVFADLGTLPGKFEAAITRAAANSAGQNSEQFAQAISASLETALGDFSGTAIGDAIVGSLQQELQDGSGESSKGTAATQRIIDEAGETVKRVGENFRKAGIEAFNLLTKSAKTVEKFAASAQKAFDKFVNEANIAAQKTRNLSAELERIVSGDNRRTVGEITQANQGAAREGIGGVTQFIEQNASLQKQLVELQRQQLRETELQGQSFADFTVEQGETKAKIESLRQNGEQLKSALESTIGDLKSELSNRLSELNQEQQAAQGIIERLFTNEAKTNNEFALARRVTEGDTTGVTRENAVQVLNDIKALQQAGLVEGDDRQVLNAAIKAISSELGLNFTDFGNALLDAATQDPAEDPIVKEQIAAIEQNSDELEQLTNALNFVPLQDSNNALKQVNEALIAEVVGLKEKTEELAKKLGEQGLSSPIEVATAETVDIRNAGKINMNEALGAPGAPTTRSTGGVIYRSQGGGTQSGINWQPRGTDTVPAMLTPGEFVVNAKATSQNRGLLESINRSTGGPVSPARRSKGGILYRSAGGPVEPDQFSWEEFLQSPQFGLNIASTPGLLKDVFTGLIPESAVAAFSSGYDNLSKWNKGFNEGLGSLWNKNFSRYVRVNGNYYPKIIAEMLAKGKISQSLADTAIPKATWSNLAPRLFANVSSKGNAITSYLTSFRSPQWLKNAGSGLYGGLMNFMNVNNSPIASWFRDGIGAKFGGLARYGGKALGVAAFAEQFIRSINAGVARQDELIAKDASGAQIFISSLGEILAGGTSPVPDPTTEGSLLNAAVGNWANLGSSMLTGYQTYGLPGAVAGAFTTTLGQTIRLGEETAGLVQDLYGENASFESAKATEERLTEAKKSSGSVLKGVDKEYDILGPLQYERARDKGNRLGDAEWYPANQQLFQSGFSDIPNELQQVQEYWDGLPLYVGGRASKFVNVDLRDFLPNLIPLGQQAGLSSGNVFGNRYSDKEIRQAYNKVAEAQKIEWMKRLTADGGREKQVYPDGAFLGTTLFEIEAKKAALDDKSLGPIIDKATGERDPDKVAFINDYQSDDKLLQLDKDYSAGLENLYTYMSNFPSSSDYDLKAFTGTSVRMAAVKNILNAIKAREGEIVDETRAKEKEAKDAQLRAQSENIDSQAAEAKDVSAISAGVLTGNLSTDYPYLNPAEFITTLQTGSLRLREGFNDLDTIDLNNESKKGPKLSSYVDFIRGALGPDANQLLKSQESIATAQNIANAIAAYRKNYVQSSPLYENVKKDFGDAVNEYIDGQSTNDEKIAAAYYKNKIFGGDATGVAEQVALLKQGTDVLAIQPEEVAVQMGYRQLVDYYKDLDKAKANNDEAFFIRQSEARDEIRKRRDQDAIAKILKEGGDAAEAGMAVLLKNEFPFAMSRIRGINFYSPANFAGTTGFGNTAGLAAGVADMVGATGGLANPWLFADNNVLSEGAISNIDKANLFYLKQISGAKTASDNATPEEIAKRAEEIQKQEAAAADAKEKEIERYKRVANYGRTLVGKPVPDTPVQWLKYRQTQIEKFADIATQTNTSPPYPEAKDIPALNESGITEQWVNNLFSKGGGLVDNVTAEGARELLRWKSKQAGVDNADELIALAQQIDGNVGLDDIYPATDPKNNDTAGLAAADLQNIWRELEQFQNRVISRNELGLPLLERNLEKLVKSGLWTPNRGLEGNLGALKALDPRLDTEGLKEKIGKFSNKTQYYNTGGAVFTARGTDTVPAMLTPGEYVVNRKAAAANRPLLDAINGGKGNRNSQRQGYYKDGGDVNGNGVNNITVDTAEISKFITSFDKFAKELAALSIPSEINIQGTHTVDVNINGAQVLNELLSGPVGQLVRDEIESAFAQQNADSEGSVPNPYSPTSYA